MIICIFGDFALLISLNGTTPFVVKSLYLSSGFAVFDAP